MALIMITVAPLTPRLSTRFGANKTVAAGMLLASLSMVLFRLTTARTPYLAVAGMIACLNAGFALSMSPMTAAIMSAVPSRRAGAGSAMNDASRELGAALGIAVMGSIAASEFSNRVDSLTHGLSPAMQERASASISGAIAVADSIGGKVGAALHVGADRAFLDGMHLSVTIGAVLCLISACLVVRYLPRVLSHEGAMHGPVESMEDVAALGIAGVPPIFADEHFPGDEVEPDVVDRVR
jgi:hypothetical protein